MFRLTAAEFNSIRSSFLSRAGGANSSQSVMSSRKHRGSAYLPLRLPRELARKIQAMQKRYDERFAMVFDAIKRLIAEDDAGRAAPKRRLRISLEGESVHAGDIVRLCWRA
jgi:hypothetical protein